MWRGIKAFVAEVAFWLFFVGMLALMHIVDSKLFELPEGLTHIANAMPRIMYPIYYGVLGLRILWSFEIKFPEPRKMGIILLVPTVLLLVVVKSFEFPAIGFLKTQYVAIFLLVFLVVLVFACASQILAANDAEMQKTPEAGGLAGKVADEPLKKSLSWICYQNGDARNRELADAIKSSFWILLLICIGCNSVIGLVYFTKYGSFSEIQLPKIVIPTVIYWVAIFFVFLRVNGKSWAPNIDADKKLRQAFGANYDGQLDWELKTKSLGDLVGENWFVRMYAQFTGDNSDEKKS